MAVMRCQGCSGRKTVIGLGSILKKCPSCNGVGYVTVVEIEKEVAPVVEAISHGEPEKVNVSNSRKRR